MRARIRLLPAAILALLMLYGCGGDNAPSSSADGNSPGLTRTAVDTSAEQLWFEADRFADIRILRYQIPGFETLSLQQKKLLYFLSQAEPSTTAISAVA